MSLDPCSLHQVGVWQLTEELSLHKLETKSTEYHIWISGLILYPSLPPSPPQTEFSFYFAEPPVCLCHAYWAIRPARGEVKKNCGKKIGTFQPQIPSWRWYFRTSLTIRLSVFGRRLSWPICLNLPLWGREGGDISGGQKKNRKDRVVISFSLESVLTGVTPYFPPQKVFTSSLTCGTD